MSGLSGVLDNSDLMMQLLSIISLSSNINMYTQSIEYVSFISWINVETSRIFAVTKVSKHAKMVVDGDMMIHMIIDHDSDLQVFNCAMTFSWDFKCLL